MKASVFQSQTRFFAAASPSFPAHKKKNPHRNFTLPLKGIREMPKQSRGLHGFSVGCAKMTEFWRGRETEAELNPECEDWVMELGTLQERCKERKGMVELLECLEREAIMGEDEGKQPIDYNRRAQIFDKSSKVFQALKERSTAHQS